MEPVPIDAPLLPARFEITHPIGSGGQKQSWVAFDRLRQRKVVVARMPTGAVGPSGRSLDQELRIHRRLGSHPRILAPEETLDFGSARFLVSPYLSGGDLARRVASQRERRLPIAELLVVAYDIAVALSHVHRLGVVHGDVAPANILLDADGRALLGDFGLARLTTSRATPTEALQGTPGYLAPETIRGAPAHFASDLYGLGCVLYEAVAGRPPFVSDSAQDLLRQHQTVTPPDLRSLRADAPRLLVMLVHSLIAKDPTARPAKVSDVAGALWGLKQAWNAYTDGAPDPDEPQQPIGRHQELASLTRAIEAASRGEPAWVMLSGDSGIGKTRLARAAMEQADRQGFLVLYATASGSRRLSHGPIVDLLIQVGFTRLRALDAADAASLRRFLYLARFLGNDLDRAWHGQPGAAPSPARERARRALSPDSRRPGDRGSAPCGSCQPRAAALARAILRPRCAERPRTAARRRQLPPEGGERIARRADGAGPESVARSPPRPLRPRRARHA